MICSNAGTVAIVHAILDQVVDDYEPVVAGIENDVDEIEDDVFDGSPHVSRRIYELAREVIVFQRATKPLVAILDGLMHARGPTTRNAATSATSRTTPCAIQEQAFGLPRVAPEHPQREPDARDQGARARRSNAQNEEVKKISAWAAILLATFKRCGWI